MKRKFVKITKEEYDEMLLCKKVVDDLLLRCDFWDGGKVYYFECSNNILKVLFPDKYEKSKLEAIAKKGENKNV